MKLVIDMNLSIEWIPELRAVGIEPVHWATIGPHEASEEAIMSWRPERHLPLVQRALSLHRLHPERGAILTLEDERVRIRPLGFGAMF